MKRLIDINLQRKFEPFLPFKANREFYLCQISMNKKGRLNQNLLEYENSCLFHCLSS